MRGDKKSCTGKREKCYYWIIFANPEALDF